MSRTVNDLDRPGTAALDLYDTKKTPKDQSKGTSPGINGKVYFVLVSIPCTCVRLVCRSKQNHPAHRFVKIGFSYKIEERMKHIKWACPFPIKLIATAYGTRKTESYLHKLYKKDRVCGEWFNFSDDIIEDINKGIIWKKRNKDFITIEKA